MKSYASSLSAKALCNSLDLRFTKFTSLFYVSNQRDNKGI